MRAEDLGFAEPCERCARQLWEGLGEWCRAHCPTAELNYAAVLQAHGHLRPAPGPDRSGAEGYSSYVACGLCGCRWRLFDWVAVGWVDLKQESADGRYYSAGQYADGKKHGTHSCNRYAEGGEPCSPLVLVERWDHGRLVAWEEYGPAALDEAGEHRQAVVRRWRAEDSA